MEDIQKILENSFGESGAVEAYIDLVRGTHHGEVMHKHHILPKALYPEYKNEAWNLVSLPIIKHVEAHKLLADIASSNGKAWHKMVCAYHLIAKVARTEIDVELLRKSNTGELNPMYGIRGKLNPNYGKPLSSERKKNISESLMGAKHPQYGVKKSEVTRLKMSESRKGVKFSDEHKANISKSKSGENHPMFGKHKSEETKSKISKAVSGTMNGGYGKVLGENHNAKRVLIDGVTYDSCLSAAIALNVAQCTIGRWIKSGKATKLPKET